MSTSSESERPESRSSPELELDLDLHFLPSWAAQPTESNKYERYRGDEGGDRRGGGGGGRGDRREGDRPRGPRPPGGPQGGGPSRGPRAFTPGGGRGPGGPPGGGGGDRRGGPSRGPGRPQDRGGRFGRPDDRERREAPAPLPAVEVSFIPEEKGVESLARQIKLTGRAYPLFEIASLILKKTERFRIELHAAKNESGAAEPFFICSLDDTVWLSEHEAVGYILDKHFATFYQAEKIAGDAPKGTYTFVAQCGISGTILGPPNYHDYQVKLRRLHSERFANMPFEVFKSRIKIVKDEEIVKKWAEEQSWKTQYITLNVPEPKTLTTREEVEQDFRQTHLPNVVRPETTVSMAGPAAISQPNLALRRLVNIRLDEQRRFPIRVVTSLSEQFQKHGLQFFKAHKNVTHVSVARPKYLDMAATPVSESLKKIVDFVESHPRATRKQLIEAFAPGVTLEATPAAPGAPETEQKPPTPELEQLISNLHWLIHQGHLIEFSSGLLQVANKPAPRPPRPEPKKQAPKTPAAAAGEASPTGAGEAKTPDANAEAASPAAATEPASPEVVNPAAGAPVEAAATTPQDASAAAEDPAAVAATPDEDPAKPQA